MDGSWAVQSEPLGPPASYEGTEASPLHLDGWWGEVYLRNVGLVKFLEIKHWSLYYYQTEAKQNSRYRMRFLIRVQKTFLTEILHKIGIQMDVFSKTKHKKCDFKLVKVITNLKYKTFFVIIILFKNFPTLYFHHIFPFPHIFSTSLPTKLSVLSLSPSTKIKWKLDQTNNDIKKYKNKPKNLPKMESVLCCVSMVDIFTIGEHGEIELVSK